MSWERQGGTAQPCVTVLGSGRVCIPHSPSVALLQCPASQEKLEENLQPVRRREDSELAGPGVCPAPLQTHPPVLHGRDRRRPGLQERLHRGLLHLRESLAAASLQEGPGGTQWPHRHTTLRGWAAAVLLLPWITQISPKSTEHTAVAGADVSMDPGL